MRGVFWNIRGTNKKGRNTRIMDICKEHNLDFIGIQETKSESFSAT